MGANLLGVIASIMENMVDTDADEETCYSSCIKVGHAHFDTHCVCVLFIFFAALIFTVN